MKSKDTFHLQCAKLEFWEEVLRNHQIHPKRPLIFDSLNSMKAYYDYSLCKLIHFELIPFNFRVIAQVLNLLQNVTQVFAKSIVFVFKGKQD